LERSTVDAALADYHAASISQGLKVTLEFLEAMTFRPTELTSKRVKAVLEAGVSVEALKDAIAVGAVFNIVTRYANALDFAVPTADEFDRAATMLLKRGYRS
jgi:alkylhydroperoxidase family enzyme